MTTGGASGAGDFIADAVRSDNATGAFSGRVQTRFPPEPNGYLHIGHAKAISADFGIAERFDGICNLRFDDTNPDTEDDEYIGPILEDVAWLGFTPAGVFHASDYFDQLYLWAEDLIAAGRAYVDEQDGETVSAQRGGFGRPGIDSPYRGRPAAESLDLFRRMKAGEFADGAMVLRAKIDMQAENTQLRDPVMYRIRRGRHFRTQDRWVIYPTYDWAHGQSDAVEGVTHSMCTLEFEDHRPLYDWYLSHLELPFDQPRQYEFARLELTHTVTSKRRLAQLVAEGLVDGWDDPRMPTLRGLRRRGYPAAAIRSFCASIGVSKTNSRHAIEELEHHVRVELNRVALRRMAVLRPLRLVIDNWPANPDGTPAVDWVEVSNNPENPDDGVRRVPFSGALYIEQDDFREVAPPKYYRLTPGREVRLRGAYLVRATDQIVKDDAGRVVEVHAVYDPATRSGQAPDGRKVKSTMHWVSAAHAEDATVNLYKHLFAATVPGQATGDPLDDIDPDSRETLTGCKAEPALKDARPGAAVQFERLGYFAPDPHQPMVFHRTVGLRDEWARLQARQNQPG
jgi:glutaminyl-tRNA synthetase